MDVDIRLANGNVVALFCLSLGQESDRLDRRCTLIFSNEIEAGGIRSPRIGSDPMVEALRQVLLLAGLPVVKHEAEAVALVSRTLLGAVGDVAAIGRIERRRVAGEIVGGDVLRRASGDRNDPQIIVGGSGWILVVIRGVANLLSVGRKGIVVLSAERERGSIVVARGK